LRKPYRGACAEQWRTACMFSREFRTAPIRREIPASEALAQSLRGEAFGMLCNSAQCAPSMWRQAHSMHS
jgi:hypothetical protein